MKNKIWVFGDSYANCTGIVSDGYYYKDELPSGSISPPLLNWFDHFYDDYAWPNQLSSLLNLELKNLSRGGIGNEYISRILIENLTKIQKNDLVVVMLSQPTRLRYLNKFDNFRPSTLIPNTLEHQMKKHGTRKEDEEYFQAFTDYVLNCIYPFGEQILQDHIKLFKDIGAIIVERGSTLIIVDHFFWNLFETWREFSKGVIQDLHWSLNGNTRFALYLHEFIRTRPLKKIHKFEPAYYYTINNKPFSYWKKYENKIKPDIEFGSIVLSHFQKTEYERFLGTNTDKK